MSTRFRVPEKLMEKQQMSSEQVDEKWDVLRRAIHQIYAKNSSSLSFQALYTLRLSLLPPCPILPFFSFLFYSFLLSAFSMDF